MSLRNFAIAWNIMWGLSYIAVALICPTISDAHPALYIILGLAILLGIYLVCWSNPHSYIGQALLLVIGCLEVFSGVASWAGVAIWNVPFEAKELFYVSMAFADLISAAFMFLLVMEKPEP